MFLHKEIDYLQSVVTAAKIESDSVAIRHFKNTSQLEKHGERITDVGRDDLDQACVLDPDCLKGL